MTATKMSVTLDPELAGAIRAAAARRAQPVSSWLADAAISKLRAEGLSDYLDAWEAEHGSLTAEELTAAERLLVVPQSGSDTA